MIADYTGEVGDPDALAARLAAVPGVIEHGLFLRRWSARSSSDGARRRSGYSFRSVSDELSSPWAT